MAFTVLRTFIAYLVKLMLVLNRQVPILHFTPVVTRVIWILHLSGLPLVMLFHLQKEGLLWAEWDVI